MKPPTLCCPACGTTYTDRWRCSCGEPLDFETWPTPGPEPPASFEGRGLWQYADLLPVTPRVTLGEGATPLVTAPDWNAQFKLEYVFPTASFKDRGATATLSRAAGVNADRVVEDSSGNAGAAIATYAARGGLDARIFVPADVKPAKCRAIRTAGAEPVRVEGTRGDVTDACLSAVENGSAFYASHAWRPSFLAGTATAAFEIAHANDWEPPDAIVTPVGHGTLFLGLFRGFDRLETWGWIDRVPRLYAAQAVGHAPIVAARHGSSAPETTGDAVRRLLDVDAPGRSMNDRADGIAIDDPVRDEAIRRAIRTTNGDAIAVGSAATDAELARLGRAGFDTEPTCATAPAALRALRARGDIDPTDHVVVPLTGSGLKTA